MLYNVISSESSIHGFKHYYTASCRINKKLIEITYRFPKSLKKNEKEVYKSYFSYETKKWINCVLKNSVNVFNEVGIALNITEQESTYTENLQKLSSRDFKYIEEKCVEIKDKQVPAPKKVVIGICKHKNKTLMVKRKIPEGNLVGQFPAGIVNPSIPEENILKYAIEDETGIVCNPLSKLGSRIHPDTKVVCDYGIVEYESGCVNNRNSRENDDVQGISLQEYATKITTNLYKPIIEFLGDYSNEE